MRIYKRYWLLLVMSGIWFVTGRAVGQDSARISIRLDSPGHRVSPDLHGVFFEEISHAGEGGLYAEMIQNRGFEECRLPQGTTLKDGFIIPPRTPHFSMKDNGVSDWKMEWPLTSQWPAWSSRSSGGLSMALTLTEAHPLNSATPHSLQVDIRRSGGSGAAQLVNEGFWGLAVKEGDDYRCSFYLRTGGQYRGMVTAGIEGKDGRLLASRRFSVSETGWTKYSCVLHAAGSDSAARFVLSFGSPGRLWADFVSVMPVHTFKNRPNGLRADLANYIAGLKPAFIRWPGGCYVEGIDIQSAPDWKRTIGPVEKRPGTYSPWGYWNSDGFGYQEYLQFCEDIGAAAMYVFNVGVSCDYRSGTFVADDSIGPYIQNALDAIEYAIGPVDSKWGRVRAASGHAAPYPLRFVEVGNEQHGPRYARRYNLFYDAIKSKYPQIKMIAAMGIGDVNQYTLDSMRRVDIADEHAYKSAWWAMNHYDHFDRHTRSDWEMYVGEYATNNGVGHGNMEAALSDAVYIMAMEKNGDLVKMSSYAPLLVNVNDVDWPVNLINFNASSSFARISYYAIRMMSENRADLNYRTAATLMPAVRRNAAFAGGIGLATWDTQTEYKDIIVEQDGQSVYHSDLINRPAEWLSVRGSWSVHDSALAQTAEGTQRLTVLAAHSFDRYTVRLKARRLSGYNAFIIPFAVKDTNTFLRAHIGSWVNSHAVIEQVRDGFEVSDLTDQVKLAKPIETGRWYDVRLEVGTDNVKCWLDGELILEYHEPSKLFALAGRNERTGDLVLKVVNASERTCIARLSLEGGAARLADSADVVTLGSGRLSDENSFTDPEKFIPITSTVKGIGTEFEYSFAPLSITVLKLHSR